MQNLAVKTPCWRGWQASLAASETGTQELVAACRAWIDWMDSPGDGLDKTIDDEVAMLNAMRDALKRFP